MHEVLVNRLGGLSLPRKSVVRLTDRPDMTLDVYCGRKTTMQRSSFNVMGEVLLRELSCILTGLGLLNKSKNLGPSYIWDCFRRETPA